MHAFLIVGRGNLQDEVLKITKRLKAKIMPYNLKRIGDVKELFEFTKLTLNERTAIVIKDIGEATEEAQNAFLKSLEEPQENLFYVLTTSNLSNCLPTIISRCQVIEVTNSQLSTFSEVLIKLEDFINASVGRKMEIISNIKDREEAVKFITNLIYEAHSKLVKGENLSNFLEDANKTLGALKANGNVQLQLTNFVVNNS